MKFQKIFSIVGHVPYIGEKNANFLYDLIVKEKLSNILELGIAHGTATCYMAAALHEIGGGKITAVDLLEVKDEFKPSAEEQLEKTALTEFVNIVRTQTGYTWFLHDDIAKNTSNGVCREVYDLVIIDGPKNWTIDGAAFFFADKLLKKDGWIIFDDYNWTYASANGRRDSTDGITHRSLSNDEQETPHIREVFELLVKQHPGYGKLLLLEGQDWAMAKKTKENKKDYTVAYNVNTRDILSKVFMRLYRKLRGR